MLSAALTRIFLWLSFLTLISSLITIFSLVSQRPFTVKSGKNGYFLLGEPGIPAEGRRVDSREKMAPDTIIKYAIAKPDSSIVGSGEIKLSESSSSQGKSTLSERIATAKSKGNIISLDTQYYLIRHRVWSIIPHGGTISHNTDDLPDGRILYTKRREDKNGHTIPPILYDTFSNIRDAGIFMTINTKENNYIIEQNYEVKEMLRLRPANTGQYVLFLCYDIIYFAFIVLLLYMMHRLFKNFAADDYFSVNNTKLLRNTGICLLAIQLLKFLFYFFFLSNIHPVKIIVTGGEVMSGAQYQFSSGVESLQIFLGLGILILSYIFLNGLRLKEEQALTV